MQNLARSELKTIYIDFLQSSMNLCLVKSDNCQGWSPTIPRMVWSPTNLKLVPHQKEVCYILRIWHLDLNHKTKTR